MFLSRWLGGKAAVVITLPLIYLLVYCYRTTTFTTTVKSSKHGFLHLVVPATSSNVELCRLLLSAAILNYPTPALINWGAKEAKDEFVQHLAKVGTILTYLEALCEEGHDDDLVYIADGFDVQFQLPPEILLSRYFQEIARADQRIAAQVGPGVAKRNDLRQTVIFGPDRHCWPMGSRHPACWAVPQVPGPKMAYGPDIKDHDSPARFLNSGNIIGPIKDVRDLFIATLALIHSAKTKSGSDQFYFANVWGVQEYARRLLQPGDPLEGFNKSKIDMPRAEMGARTEYHIGLDYNWQLFQTVADYYKYISWMTFDGAPLEKKEKFNWHNSVSPQQQIVSPDWYIGRPLPDDIASAKAPFETLISADPNAALPRDVSWKDLQLGANVISGSIFPVLHYTAFKVLRHWWWKRLWFMPYAEEMLKASVKVPYGPFTEKEIGGRVWWPGQIVGRPSMADWAPEGTKGGTFTSNGTFLSWESTCGVHEEELFVRGEWANETVLANWPWR